MREILLTRDHKTIVDDEDFEELSKHNWYASTVSAQDSTGPRAIRTKGSNKISMARVIMKCPNYLYIDHKNGDTLDNCRENLRLCNDEQNSQNSRKQKGNISSKYKGVGLHKDGKWRARWMYKYLGLFLSEKKAAEAYDKEALR